MAEYDEAYAVAAKQELRALQVAEKDAQRVDMLKFQLQEIEEANIYVGGEEQLRREEYYSFPKNPKRHFKQLLLL